MTEVAERKPRSQTLVPSERSRALKMAKLRLYPSSSGSINCRMYRLLEAEAQAELDLLLRGWRGPTTAWVRLPTSYEV